MKYNEGGSTNTSIGASELVGQFEKGYKISKRIKETEEAIKQ